MKKTRLLLALAMVFAALSFGFKAKAQGTVPVLFTLASGSFQSWSGSYWYFTLHNNTTNEDFYLYNNYYQLRDDGAYHMGYVTPGYYSVTVSYYNGGVTWGNFDWYINDQSGNKSMYWQTDYELVSSVEASDVYYYNPNYGLNIYIWGQ
ncbi:hypothetical protein KXQ82_17105 [Mucilaginibacter sp. HMF5004]|uniref:hypothetical protein n=1 Tax=Mucilaginibacter rivuli TaxID=2857527 RepID=UPI001C5E150B|nr:hypothetical protein [Mucilaginibacter rivuli]MBW4891449.1 hypothetical protein [Mucilaginibacter rivuli]